MTTTAQEAIEAIKTIKEFCKEQGEAGNCWYIGEGKCPLHDWCDEYVDEFPATWQIPQERTEE